MSTPCLYHSLKSVIYFSRLTATDKEYCNFAFKLNNCVIGLAYFSTFDKKKKKKIRSAMMKANRL